MPSIFKSTADISIRFFRKSFEQLGLLEQNVIKTIFEGVRITKNTNKVFTDQMTFGQRVADRVASFGGSWTFILIFLAILISWVTINSFFLSQSKVFDPYPYILLNLFLSMLAGVQAAALLIAAKRADAIASEIAVHTEKNTDDLKDLVNENTALTEQVKRATDLLDEIHRHVSALTPGAGRFPPDQEPRQSSR